MAVVYRAYHESLNRYVAIKVLPPQLALDATFVQRFLQEARSAAGLKHPNIVTIYDVGVEDGIHYIVMEELQGEPLDGLIRKVGSMPVEQSIQITTQIASALDYAHARGIVHRDIKPANIIIGSDGKATLTDFGIAKAAEGTNLTQTGMMVGTPEYMSPEQVKGESVGASSDIYSLGIVLYQMLTGSTPFTASNTPAILHKQVYEQPRPLHTQVGGISADLDKVLATALAKDPANRYPSAGAFADELSTISTEQTPVSVKPGASSDGPVARKQRPGGVWSAIVSVMIMIAVAFLGYWIWKELASGGNPMTPTVVNVLKTPAPTEVALNTPASETTIIDTPTAIPSPIPSPTASPSPTATIIPSPTSQPAAATVNYPTANVRRGPGTDYGVLGIAKIGERLLISGRNTAGDWWQVDFGEESGWIIANLVIAEGVIGDVPVIHNIPPLPTPMPTLTPVPGFHPVSIADQATSSLSGGFSDWPRGRVELGGVLFDIPSGENVVTTQAETLKGNPTKAIFELRISSPIEVHLLITGGNLYSRFMGQRIGIVRLEFENGQQQSFPLVAGDNIREWKLLDNQTVSSVSSSDSQEVWRSASTQGGNGIIDKLTLRVTPQNQASLLRRIIVSDMSSETAGSLDPALNLVGVTVLGGKNG